MSTDAAGAQQPARQNTLAEDLAAHSLSRALDRFECRLVAVGDHEEERRHSRRLRLLRGVEAARSEAHARVLAKQVAALDVPPTAAKQHRQFQSALSFYIAARHARVDADCCSGPLPPRTTGTGRQQRGSCGRVRRQQRRSSRGSPSGRSSDEPPGLGPAPLEGVAG